MPRSDPRPALFRTFRFTSLDESAAFIGHLARIGAEHAGLISARLFASEVRVRIDPDPAQGKPIAQQLMAELKEVYFINF